MLEEIYDFLYFIENMTNLSSISNLGLESMSFQLTRVLDDHNNAHSCVMSNP